MMLYDFIKPLAKIFYPRFYDLEIKGKDKIPTNTPIVFAANHTNAFVDPVIFAMLIKQKVRFFARGDVFKGKLLCWAFNQFNMSPIYRAQDGFTGADRNEATFAECRTRLNNNESLLIYPEGICIQEKRLQPLKKGLGRILFSKTETSKLEKDTLVFPLGLNYSDAKTFRSKVFINVGDPISIDSFRKANSDLAEEQLIGKFTSSLEGEMKKLIVNIAEKVDDTFVENVNEILVDQFVSEQKASKKDLDAHFSARKKVAELINYLRATKPSQTDELKEKVSSYSERLSNYNFRDHIIRPEALKKTNSLSLILDFLILWIMLPIYGLGLLLNYLPFYLGKKFTENKVKDVVFVASSYLNLSMFAWLAYYLLQLLIVGLVFKSWLILGIYALFTPLIGVFVLKFYPVLRKKMGRWAFLRLLKADKNEAEALLKDRTEIINLLSEARKELKQAS